MEIMQRWIGGKRPRVSGLVQRKGEGREPSFGEASLSTAVLGRLLSHAAAEFACISGVIAMGNIHL
jgi:hypothetical protein